MTGPVSFRGAVPVGACDQLGPLEAAAVRAFRLWFSGPECRAELWNDYAGAFGARAGRARLKALERFLSLLVDSARRPVMRHGVHCRCLGADESALAHLVAAAAEGAREEAMVLACALVRPDMATTLVAAAEGVAPCLARLPAPRGRDDALAAASHQAPATRH